MEKCNNFPHIHNTPTYIFGTFYPRSSTSTAVYSDTECETDDMITSRQNAPVDLNNFPGDIFLKCHSPAIFLLGFFSAQRGSHPVTYLSPPYLTNTQEEVVFLLFYRRDQDVAARRKFHTYTISNFFLIFQIEGKDHQPGNVHFQPLIDTMKKTIGRHDPLYLYSQMLM